MSTTPPRAAATDSSGPDAAATKPAEGIGDLDTGAWVAGVLLIPAALTAVFVLHLPVVATVGFSVFVPSAIGSTVQAVIDRDRGAQRADDPR